MPASLERSALHVEGRDDAHTIIHLLIRNGIDYDSEPWPPEFPKVIKIEGIKSMLAGMEIAVQTSGGRVIGFVLDADAPLTARWDAVRQRLAAVGVATPDTPPPDGFVGHSARFGARVGVWLMPDNQHEGKLEHFLQTLIAENDRLIGHATQTTQRARELGAIFPQPDELKAIIHAWLAWQKEPGLPYGTAIRAKYFRHDSPVAAAFVAWFKRLYGIS